MQNVTAFQPYLLSLYIPYLRDPLIIEARAQSQFSFQVTTVLIKRKYKTSFVNCELKMTT